MNPAARHLIAAMIGAWLAGLAGMLFVPQLFWGLLVSGALIGGAVSVARVVFGGDEE